MQDRHFPPLKNRCTRSSRPAPCAMGIAGTEFTSAAAVAVAIPPARAVHVLALDRCSPPVVVAAASRLVTAVFNAASEIGPERDALLVLSVSGTLADDRVMEVLSTASSLALHDRRSEKTCVARIKQLCRAGEGASRREGSEAVEYSDRFVERVSAFVCERFSASPVHLYLASTIVGSVSADMDIPINAFPSQSACRSMHLITGEREQDIGTLFGEVIARVLSSRVTLRVGKILVQLLARPRICGTGFLPAMLSLTAYRRVAIEAIPEDVLFGLPTALFPDDDAEQDTASLADSGLFASIASDLFKRQEALLAVERNGPHLVLLPTAPNMILLREVASKTTLLPAPVRSSVSSNSPQKDAVDLCLAHAAAWNMTNEIIDDVVLSTFKPLEFDGGEFAPVDARKAVDFSL